MSIHFIGCSVESTVITVEELANEPCTCGLNYCDLMYFKFDYLCSVLLLSVYVTSVA